ncbi:hypothetical protein Q9L58_006075 [Maublancomyces gigas]|uniref:Uncharacterized protein n=1 Tax=Discina gigas TaxID=1032678 RepID=A0ABR3GG62_9PEZI
MLPYFLPLVLLFTTAHAWQLTATLTNGKVQKLTASLGAPRSCDGLPWGNFSINYFDWIPNVGATTIELYPLDNCLGTKRVSVPGRNNVDPDTAYYTYKVLA